VTRAIGCRCGAIAYRAEGAPERISYCHCADCRAQTGAPVSVFVSYAQERVARLGAEPARWSAHPGTARLFCTTCGAQIAYLDTGLPEEIFFTLGACAQPDDLAPGWHAFESERLAWFDTADTLTRHDRFSVARPRLERGG